MTYKDSSSFNTLPGGAISIVINVFMVWIIYTQLITMFYFGNNSITVNETTANYKRIGKVSMGEEDFIPYYRILYKGMLLKPEEYAKLSEYITIRFQQIAGVNQPV